MFWIIANDCAFLMILSVRECNINKLYYGVLHQLPATSGHIKSKQQTFTLIAKTFDDFAVMNKKEYYQKLRKTDTTTTFLDR